MLSPTRHDPDFFQILCASHLRFAGRPLTPASCGASWLYEEAPFGVLAHGGGADPRFVYANRCAQRCFEYAWDEIVGMPSRLSAEPAERVERQKLLDAVARNGFATGYSGVRVAKSGRRFWIENGVVWTLIAANGSPVGQAASFGAWRDA